MRPVAREFKSRDKNAKKNNVICGFIRILVLNTLIFIDVTVGVVHCSLLFANDCDFVV